MRLDAMPPEYRADFVANPHAYWIPPFQVAGNLYAIGNREIGCYLIDSGEGLIILDTGYNSCAGQFFNNIWQLGFRPQDVKMIFHTHNHEDHIGSTNLLVQMSGATTYMSETDGKELAKAVSGACSGMAVFGNPALRFVPDVYTHDGDTFTLGNVTVTCIDTPGHTKGCQSFFFDVTMENGSLKRAALHGGVGINTLHKEFMEMAGYPDAREDFFGQLNRIMDWPVDINLGSHVLQNYTMEKLAKRKEDPNGPNPFIDKTEWKQLITLAKDMACEMIEKEEKGEIPSWQRGLYADIKQQK